MQRQPAGGHSDIVQFFQLQRIETRHDLGGLDDAAGDFLVEDAGGQDGAQPLEVVVVILSVVDAGN